MDERRLLGLTATCYLQDSATMSRVIILLHALQVAGCS